MASDNLNNDDFAKKLEETYLPYVSHPKTVTFQKEVHTIDPKSITISFKQVYVEEVGQDDNITDKFQLYCCNFTSPSGNKIHHRFCVTHSNSLFETVPDTGISKTFPELKRGIKINQDPDRPFEKTNEGILLKVTGKFLNINKGFEYFEQTILLVRPTSTGLWNPVFLPKTEKLFRIIIQITSDVICIKFVEHDPSKSNNKKKSINIHVTYSRNMIKK